MYIAGDLNVFVATTAASGGQGQEFVLLMSALMSFFTALAGSWWLDGWEGLAKAISPRGGVQLVSSSQIHSGCVAANHKTAIQNSSGANVIELAYT